MGKLSVGFTFSVPHLFGGAKVQIDELRGLAWFVGPNGSGKSHVLQRLAAHLGNARAAFISARRGVGLEEGMGSPGGVYRGGGLFNRVQPKGLDRQEHFLDAGIGFLEQDPALLVEVTSRLRAHFGREIVLDWFQGFPRVRVSREGVDPFSVAAESQGIKNLLALLGYVVAPRYEVVVIDEPETALHPQFQALLLREMRRAVSRAEESGKPRAFVLATHSPFIFDPRTPDDFGSTFFFIDAAKKPVRLDPSSLTPAERGDLARLLVRLDAQTKQMFFSPRPVFVEGPSDHAVLTAIADRADLPLVPDGGALIALGGKDEIPHYRRICRLTGRSSAVIADLDVLTRGRVFDDLKNESAVVELLRETAHAPKGPQELCGELRALAADLGQKVSVSPAHDPPSSFVQAVAEAINGATGGAKQDARAYLVLLLIQHARAWLIQQNEGLEPAITSLAAKLRFLLQLARTGGVHLLPGGAIEAHYEEPSWVSDDRKARRAEEELNRIAQASCSEVRARYGALVRVLCEAVPAVELQLEQTLGELVRNVVHSLQCALLKSHQVDKKEVERLLERDHPSFVQVENVSTTAPDKPAEYRVQLRLDLYGKSFSAEFSHDTVPARVRVQEMTATAPPKPGIG